MFPMIVGPTPQPLAIRESRPPTTRGRAMLKRLEEIIVDSAAPLIDIDDSTTHHFAAGLYARQWRQAAGTIATSKTHRLENFLVVLEGECVLTNGEDSVRVKAPYVTKTLPGVKRAVLALTDIIIMTFHPNPDDETDLEVLEDRYITPELFPRPALEHE